MKSKEFSTLRLVGSLFAATAAFAGGNGVALSPAADRLAIPVTVDELATIWRDRAGDVQTVHASMNVVRWHAKGSELPPPGADPNTFYPAEDSTFELQAEFWLDGNLWRMDYRGPKWHPPTSRYMQTHFVDVANDQKLLHYFGIEEMTNLAHPKAFLKPIDGAKARGVSAAGFMWLANFRNDHSTFQSSISPEEWELHRSTAIINDLECYSVSKRHPAGIPVFTRMWIAPDLNHAIVRYESGVNRTTIEQMDISYLADPGGMWLPAALDAIVQNESGDGVPFVEFTESISVGEIVINEPVDGNPFEFSFPTGTVVDELLPDGTKTSYVVKDDTVKRTITDEEKRRPITYLDLLSTPSGEAGRPVRRSTPWYSIWIGFSVVVFFVGLWIIRRGGV